MRGRSALGGTAHEADPVVAVVIPCYKVIPTIGAVLSGIGPEVARIYCVDDACPHGSGSHIVATCDDPRVTVLANDRNLGVGGATMHGFRRALADGADVIVKIDGDGQMDPRLIEQFVRPILDGRADYTKGNRFFDLAFLERMPRARLVGNAVLSFLTKLSSGYWNMMDPNNGYVAIHRTALAMLPLERISQRYFFESDLLFRLNTVGAVLEEVPMESVYAGEVSSLRITEVWAEFLVSNIRNFLKRIAYNYFLRGFSVASVELVLGLMLTAFGLVFGVDKWLGSVTSGVPVTAGTAMLAGLPLLLGMQFLLAFLAYDMRTIPPLPLHRRHGGERTRRPPGTPALPATRDHHEPTGHVDRREWRTTSA